MIETLSDEDKLLVRYLFNELDKDEARELEDEMLLDEELGDRAEVLEMNLIDCYVRNELSADERVRFEEGFLADPENKDKLNHAMMFHESLRLLHEKDQLASGSDQRWRRGLSAIFARPVPALALFTTVVLLIAALGVFEIRRRGHNANNLATNSSLAANVQQNTNVASQNNSPEPVPSEPELAQNNRHTQYEYIHRQDSNSGERAGETAHFILGPQAKNLVLRYELIDDKAAQRETFGVTIKNQYGERIWPQNKAKVEIEPVFTKGTKRRKFIAVKIPVKVLTDGGPYLFELDDNYLPAKQFTVKK